jgi:hypothetical protein
LEELELCAVGRVGNEVFEFFKKQRNMGNQLPKIRLFENVEDLRMALPQEKFWGYETEVGWLVSQSRNHQLRMFF